MSHYVGLRTRTPDRYGPSGKAAVGAILLLLGLLGPLMGVQPSQGIQHESFPRDGVVFKFQGEIYFSDSEWVVVTDVFLGSIETAINALRHWFTATAKHDKSLAEAEGERLRRRGKTSDTSERNLATTEQGTPFTEKRNQQVKD